MNFSEETLPGGACGLFALLKETQMTFTYEPKPQMETKATGPGELMECLLREKARYASDEEFRAFAIEAVRRFITDLRGLDIEISLRANHDRQRTLP